MAGRKELGIFVLFTDSVPFTEGGGRSREEVIAQGYNRQMPRAEGNFCLAGDQLHSIQDKEANQGEQEG